MLYFNTYKLQTLFLKLYCGFVRLIGFPRMSLLDSHPQIWIFFPLVNEQNVLIWQLSKLCVSSWLWLFSGVDRNFKYPWKLINNSKEPNVHVTINWWMRILFIFTYDDIDGLEQCIWGLSILIHTFDIVHTWLDK